ncbi:hypothetical protein D9615_006326 [Tricholomella constricta]|uniref:RIC1 C-terminal alpha solenoid region domain-containing protein n=1 Tax=Tricholomella constricta TaxID=117010 RepID=A0A8H5M1B2_9AGAR|nr:hypothetical protein D9615_006326 [Tricholomella constricta]
MYFPTSAARQLSTVPALPNLPPESVICLCPSPRKALFCTLTRNGVTVWRIRPPAVLAYLSRTPTSVIDHGENIDVQWSPDSSRLVIRTSESYLVLVSVVFKPEETVYQAPPTPLSAQRIFLAGPGEGLPFQSIGLVFEGVVRVDGTLLSVSPRRHHVLFSTKNPPTIQRIPWPVDAEDGTQAEMRKKNQQHGYDTWIFNDHDFSWFIDTDVSVVQILHSRTMGIETWITSDGRAYFVRLHENLGSERSTSALTDDDATQDEANHHRMSFDSTSGAYSHKSWRGTCVHDFETPRWVQKQRRIDPDEPLHQGDRVYKEPRRVVAMAINSKFSFIAIGTYSGGLEFTNFPSQEGVTPKSQSIYVPNPYNRQIGEVCALEWSSDGYVLAVGWKHGWGIFSVGGRCLASGFGVDDLVDEDRFQDAFMYGVRNLFWAPGNYELVVLAQSSPRKIDGQLFVIPFAKSATTGQHSPDNTRYAFLQMDDRALVYRGADQPDMSVINPESDVWQHIKIPQSYLATNWPIQYSSLSSDGRLIAIAGRRGLIHYSSTSGRWKMFNDEQQEQAFVVKGGLLWFHHVLIAAVEVARTYQVRLYSRDMELSNQNVLHREVLPSQVVILSLVDNSLLVYTADNTLFHFLIVPTAETIKLHLCGSITFNGIISAPSAVRMLSWMIPSAQKQLGDPVDDLSVATVLMVVGGQLILLRPRKSANQEVKYDMQIFADRIEFCWIHLRGIGTLENSLWGYDGQGIRVWLNALAIETRQGDKDDDKSENVKESVNIPLDFYPLSVLMDKGIIIGAEHEAATRSNLSFVMFRHATSSHLFLHHILRFLLGNRQVKEAVTFAAHYKELVYFAHALEILLHTVVESEATLESESESEDGEIAPDAVLPTVVEFLDHFDAALDVVVGCARKTELTRWRRLFSIVGNPKSLFETCLASQRLKTAGSYLLVLHNLEQLDEDNDDAVRLLKSAVDGKDWQLCRELLRFLHSVDDTGAALRKALSKTNVVSFIEDGEVVSNLSSSP